MVLVIRSEPSFPKKKRVASRDDRARSALRSVKRRYGGSGSSFRRNLRLAGGGSLVSGGGVNGHAKSVSRPAGGGSLVSGGGVNGHAKSVSRPTKREESLKMSLPVGSRGARGERVKRPTDLERELLMSIDPSRFDREAIPPRIIRKVDSGLDEGFMRGTKSVTPYGRVAEITITTRGRSSSLSGYEKAEKRVSDFIRPVFERGPSFESLKLKEQQKQANILRELKKSRPGWGRTQILSARLVSSKASEVGREIQKDFASDVLNYPIRNAALVGVGAVGGSLAGAATKIPYLGGVVRVGSRSLGSVFGKTLLSGAVAGSVVYAPRGKKLEAVVSMAKDSALLTGGLSLGKGLAKISGARAVSYRNVRSANRMIEKVMDKSRGWKLPDVVVKSRAGGKVAQTTLLGEAYSKELLKRVNIHEVRRLQRSVLSGRLRYGRGVDASLFGSKVLKEVRSRRGVLITSYKTPEQLFRSPRYSVREGLRVKVEEAPSVSKGFRDMSKRVRDYENELKRLYGKKSFRAQYTLERFGFERSRRQFSRKMKRLGGGGFSGRAGSVSRRVSSDSERVQKAVSSMIKRNSKEVGVSRKVFQRSFPERKMYFSEEDFGFGRRGRSKVFSGRKQRGRFSLGVSVGESFRNLISSRLRQFNKDFNRFGWIPPRPTTDTRYGLRVKSRTKQKLRVGRMSFPRTVSIVDLISAQPGRPRPGRGSSSRPQPKPTPRSTPPDIVRLPSFGFVSKKLNSQMKKVSKQQKALYRGAYTPSVLGAALRIQVKPSLSVKGISLRPVKVR